MPVCRRLAHGVTPHNPLSSVTLLDGPLNVTPRGYNRPMDNQQPPGVAERADRFLRSTTGRATVHRILATQRLPRTLADDLCQDVLRRVIVASSQQGTAIDNLEGFVTRALHHAAVDIVRGRIRSPQTVGPRVTVDPDADGRSWSHDAIASPLDVEADALAFESLAAVRRAIHQLLGLDPTAGAAALAYLAITVDGARTGPDCPQPAGGANPREAADWVGLWYAGCDHCFPSDDDATTRSTVRKRRSRAMERVHDLLVRSAVAVGLGPQNGRAQTPAAARTTTRQDPPRTTALVVSPSAPPAMTAAGLQREGAVGG